MDDYKTFNDQIHGPIHVHPLCCKIMNTMQFHRLRNLKQMGFCYSVYPSASHNRFEHSLGVSYLGGNFVKKLQSKQPELGITEQDVLCVEIAGLCHDLGHGPYSHAWEQFMKNFDKDYSHESMSIRILEELVEKNDLWPQFEKYGLDANDLTFIKEAIRGHPLTGGEFKGRSPNKYFLYEIISNGKTKIDVDKFDYILRDGQHLNISNAFDNWRIMDNCKVLKKDNSEETFIAYRLKVLDSFKDLFTARFQLHKRACHHRAKEIIEQMFFDALNEAQECEEFVFPGSVGKKYKMSEAYQDVSVFMKLDDDLFNRFLKGDAGPKAAKIAKNIVERKLYSFIGFFDSKKHQLVENLYKELQGLDNIILLRSTINYGMGDNNPISKIPFYEKRKESQAETVTFRSVKATDTQDVYYIVTPSTGTEEITLKNKVKAIFKNYPDITLKCE